MYFPEHNWKEKKKEKKQFWSFSSFKFSGYDEFCLRGSFSCLGECMQKKFQFSEKLLSVIYVLCDW